MMTYVKHGIIAVAAVVVVKLIVKQFAPQFADYI